MVYFALVCCTYNQCSLEKKVKRAEWLLVEEKKYTHVYDITTLPSVEEQIARQVAVMEYYNEQVLITTCTVQESHLDMEGLGVIPSLSDLAGIWGWSNPLGKGYASIVKRLVGRLGGACHRHVANSLIGNWLTGDQGILDNRHLWLMPSLREQYQQLESLVPAKEGYVRFFVIPMNFGIKYQGIWPTQARTNALQSNSMILDPAAVAGLLMGWPERLDMNREEGKLNLGIFCPGAELEGLRGTDCCCHLTPELTFSGAASDSSWELCKERFGSIVAFPELPKTE